MSKFSLPVILGKVGWTFQDQAMGLKEERHGAQQ